ncbi:hypothetical protein L1I30_05680 [Gillisia sp. M10.2A]|uniref:Uncharacterized protein n=1 Tax=Gillisia lutea TaxID=2909668 RepID=A0ABS9EE48_9FLAO|nr:hypothetical protein [Gillisia lutea]MCF4101147.1 hypothetical protein [Gillisia lutea]
MNIRLTIGVFLMAVIFANISAQNTNNSAKKESDSSKSYILTDVSYISDAVFMGRRDSIKAPYIMPSIGYYDKSGFYADASASYLVGSEENRVDLFLVSAGYLFDVGKLGGGIAATKYFFNDDSYNVQSETQGNLTGFLSYDFEVAELSVIASSYFNDGSSADFFGGLMLAHNFYGMDNKLLISPSVSMYMGSQYFYEEYYNTSRLGNRKGKGTGQGSGGAINTVSSSISIDEASEFNILNVELSLPFQYYHNSFIFSIAPYWSFPQTSSTITTEDQVFTEDLDDIFYVSVGISYWFNTAKN